MSSPLTLRTLLGMHPGTAALKTGRVASPLVAFDYADVKVINTQFKAMMRDLQYDFGEVAIVTYLQGYERGTPYVLLPATILGRNQHHTIFYNAERGPLTPGELNGKRIGVRAYSQTTGAWVRGFLAEEYGVDLATVTWVCFEDAHVAGYQAPANVVRAPDGKQLTPMLLAGEIDAAILGDVDEQRPLKRLIPDHEAAGQRWARTHGGVPINHMAVIRQSIAETRPDVVGEVYRLLKESRDAAALPTGADDPVRFGIRANQRSIQQIITYAVEQRLIARPLTAEELFADARRIIGDDAE